MEMRLQFDAYEVKFDCQVFMFQILWRNTLVSMDYAVIFYCECPTYYSVPLHMYSGMLQSSVGFVYYDTCQIGDSCG